MQITVITLDQLEAHPDNANCVPDDIFEKLMAHIQRTGRYPPIIVRPAPSSSDSDAPDGLRYQILDGHHRVKALGELGKTSARCLVWDVDDREALVLLATLNRLEGRDAPRKRAHLLGELSGRFEIDIDELATLTPERRDELDRLLTLNDPPPSPYEPVPLEQMPVAVHFFLLPAQKRSLDARLREMGGSREASLMELVGGGSQQPNEVNE